jgi:hypothetical protein
MKSTTKKITKIVVAIAAAIFTILVIIFLGIPTHTVGDSDYADAVLIIATTEYTSTISTTIEVEITTKAIDETTTQAIDETITTTQTIYETTKAIEVIPETTTTTVIMETYVIYKPSTHYIHMNTCRWAASDEVQRIENTEGIEARRCSECNPSMEIITEYIEPVPEVIEPTGSMTYVKNFTRGTYYAYGGQRIGGSQRQLIDCSIGDGTVKGSIASSYLYGNYGYNYNGKRTMVYLEIENYSQMNGYYYLDDCDAGNSNVIDFYFLYESNCPFQEQGVVQVDCYIVNY